MTTSQTIWRSALGAYTNSNDRYYPTEVNNYLSDDPFSDPTAPASTEHVELLSSGHRLHGVLHLPPGEGPHPVVLLLHGFPGWERNFDVAQALRRAGLAALVFHYRGCWGMPGTWSWANALSDVEAVADALLDGSWPTGYPVDPARVAIVGHSLGGFLALAAAASRRSVRVVSSVSGFDFGAVSDALRHDPTLRQKYVDAFDAESCVLSGTSGESLTREMEQEGEKWSLRRMAPAFGGRHVLLIGTSRDDVTPAAIHHDPLVRAFSKHGIQLRHDRMRTDHALSDHRIALTRHLVDFVRDYL